MTVEELRAKGWIVLEALSGSRAYGLDTPTSDIDLKGVFVQPLDDRLGCGSLDQVASERNDEVYWELDKFLDLLVKANPSALELLHTPEPSMRRRHPLLSSLDGIQFLTLQCKDTFAGYAMGQVKRARGLNKKIVNPMPENRLGVLDFCHVAHGSGSLPLREWLSRNGLDQSRCGLCAIDHMPQLYALHVAPEGQEGFRGIVRDESSSTEPSLSSIPKSIQATAYLMWNKDAYAKHCRDHEEYWTWVRSRNAQRYESTIEHGKNYDAKNMMHTFRLLHMALEILSGQGIQVHRSKDREDLLQIKSGEFAYEDLLERANDLLARIELAGATCRLPESVDTGAIASLRIALRRGFDRLDPWKGAI